ncbi:hypothetical protein ENUP19_0325G0003 [Entamoeba nuttalli]|uniref:Importin, putative n=3 Tax=Entamoeba nuttalli TaxID=412467 RepID=K2HT49_ENTNP|nr:importin, putative [Entamoeba nuttalli P19]EKE39295.1 importin, putative [Entamoeba nuttalli P19]|eukprot:XP_008858372.1 importin, putative [Entamoeba nuttalli P19]
MSLTDQIHHACQLSLSGNNNSLTQANEMFNVMFNNPEFGTTAINILSNTQEPLVVQQIVSINFKHYIKLIWENLNEESKAKLCELLMQLIIRAPGVVQTQLIETLRFILVMDFPGKCGGLLQIIQSLIQNPEIISNEISFKGVMASINTFAKSFRFQTENYAPMMQFIEVIFPTCLRILITAIQNRMYVHTRLCFKLFKYIIYTKVPSFFNKETIDLFYTNAIAFLQQPFTFNNNDEKNAQCSSLIGLIRGTSSFISHNTSKASRATQTVTYFVDNIATQFINAMLPHLNLTIPSKLMFYEISLLSHCLKTSKLSKVILQFFPVLFEKIIFRQIMVTPNELEEMKTAPVDYLRNRDEDDDFGSIDGRTASINFIRATIQYRAKTFLPYYIQPLLNLIPVDQHGLEKDPIIIDCACFIMGKICGQFVISKDYAKYVPSILSVTVPLLLSSGNTLLIRRGCDLAGIVFRILNFQKTSVLPDYVIKVVQMMFQLLSSNDVIARVSAGSVIGIFVDYNCLSDSFKSVLVQLFEVLLQTIKVFESENVVETLSELIKRFPNETRPHSIDIVKALLDVLISIENNYGELDENAQMNATFSASSAVTSITDIMRMNSTSNESMNIFIELFLPYINRLLTADSLFAKDSLENTFSLACELVRLAPTPLNPRIQDLFTIILNVSLNMSYDGLTSAEPLITVFIAKQPELLNIPTNMQLVMKLINSVLSSPDIDIEALCVFRIAQAVLLCCDGQVDTFVEFLIKTTLPLLRDPQSMLALQGTEVILYCIFYNTRLTITILNSLGILNQFFSLWNSFIPKKLPALSDKKITIVALMSLMTLPVDQLPDFIKNNLTGFYNTVITLLVETENQRKRCEEYKIKNAHNLSKSIRDSTIQNLNDDEDVVYEDINNLENYDFDDYLDDFSDDIIDSDEDELVNLDERGIFFEILKRVMEGDLKDERHAAAIRNLPEGLRGVVQTIIIEQTAKQQQN